MKVLVSTPNTGWLHKHVAFAAAKLLMDSRYKVTWIQPTWTPYEHSLNRIAFDVLEYGYDWWLNIDADNPPMRNPLDLIEFDHDVCGCPTPVFHNKGNGECPIYFSALDYVPEEDAYRPHPVQEGLRQVDAIGSGCMLVARRTLEAVERPWFVRLYDVNGRVTKGPDFNFCDSVRAAGLQVWAHFGYPCRHFNEIELIEATQALQGVRKADQP